MQAKILPNGHLQIPVPAYGPDGLTGDGLEEITPDDPRFAKWYPTAVPPGPTGR